MKNYFVTGATGAIGSALIPILLQDAGTHIRLLLRAKSPEDLASRLEALFNFWQIPVDDVSNSNSGQGLAWRCYLAPIWA
ncbi:MAG: SDR family oxidoreductase [Propionivibrio sp.]|nr:SDR family oxidoreductase [Propionivibrio sp.]